MLPIEDFLETTSFVGGDVPWNDADTDTEDETVDKSGTAQGAMLAWQKRHAEHAAMQKQASTRMYAMKRAWAVVQAQKRAQRQSVRSDQARQTRRTNRTVSRQQRIQTTAAQHAQGIKRQREDLHRQLEDAVQARNAKVANRIQRKIAMISKHLPGQHNQLDHGRDKNLTDENAASLADKAVSDLTSGDDLFKGQWTQEQQRYDSGAPTSAYSVILPNGNKLQLQIYVDTSYTKTRQRLRLPAKTSYTMSVMLRMGMIGRSVFQYRVIGESDVSEAKKAKQGDIFRKKLEKQTGIQLGKYDAWGTK